MLITKKRHNSELKAIHGVLKEKDLLIAELEERAAKAERAAHELTENARYALQVAADVLREKNQSDGDTLAVIAYSLPYVLSGRRHWNEAAASEERVVHACTCAEEITRLYGFTLPKNPVDAVLSLLALSCMLLAPSHKVRIEALREAYPLEQITSL